MERRAFLNTVLGGGLAFPLGLFLGSGCSSSVVGPLPRHLWPSLDENPLGYAGLATSLFKEGDYEPKIRGNLPVELNGDLYRNGPALFDRGPDRKRMILDGDGMIHQFRFRGGKAHYRNKFVETPKFKTEQSEGKFLYPTWATPLAGGRKANRGLEAPNTASVTVLRTNSALYALDDDQPPVKLDPETIETISEWDMGISVPNAYKAHFKTCSRSGDQYFFGTELARKNSIYTAIFDKNLGLRHHWIKELPRRVYLHDWSVTEKHVVHIIHPAKITLAKVISKSLGYGTLASLISWDPDEGNLIYVQDKEGKKPPLYFEAPAIWVWHTLNAYEKNNEIIVDFIGSSDVLSGDDSEETTFYSVMRGDDPTQPSTSSPLMRYVINLKNGRLTEETIADEDQYEMPFVNQRFACHQHRYGYVARDGQADRFWSSIARIDTHTGAVDIHDFGQGHYCTEPVFVPKANFHYQPESADEPGWVLTLIYSAKTKISSLAILEADHLGKGPIAFVDLRHHVPMSLHGSWYPAS